jgi:thymidylate synthase (FAD)
MIISQLEAHITDVPNRDAGIQLLKKIEYITRVSHRTEDRITEDTYDRFLRSVVLTHGDFSVIEHASVSVEAELDRGVSHEWVRHRIAAYTQESTRFVNYSKKSGIRVIQPQFKTEISRKRWIAHMLDAETNYLALLDAGEPPEIARSVLPTCTATKLVATYNLRMWRHFFIMRTSKETHPQMKAVTIPLLAEFQQKIPILYEDIIPEMRQAEAMRLLR